MIQLDSMNFYETKAPDGRKIQVPEGYQPESDPYIGLTQPEQQKKYYDQYGYLVVRNALPQDVCDRILGAFEREVKPCQGYIYRQTSSFPEKHQLSEHGHILNSIKHIQDMSPKEFPNFIEAAFQGIGHANIRNVVKTLIGDDGVIVQTMLFEGNPATPPHADSYYLDSADPGCMVAVWIALEDIHPGAGRFFVYPGSHKLNLPENAGEFEISFHHDNYLKEINRLISDPALKCHAPMMRKGDILFWNANTIHGSLETTAPAYSRKSLTAHFIPAGKGYVLFQSVPVKMNLRKFNDSQVHCPKDPRKFTNRLQMFGLRKFPQATNFIRKCIIRLRMR